MFSKFGKAGGGGQESSATDGHAMQPSVTPVGGFTRPNGTSSGVSVTGGISGGMGSIMSSAMGGSLLSMDKGPLAQQYEVGKLIGTGGPCFVWKIYEGYRKSDGKVSTQSIL